MISSTRVRSLAARSSICVVGRSRSRVREADGDDDAVERPLGAEPLDGVEEREPLVVIVVFGREAARGVEQDRFLREPPVAVARAGGALDLRGVRRPAS